MGQPVSIPARVSDIGCLRQHSVLPTSSMVCQVKHSVMSGQFGGVGLVLGCGVASWSLVISLVVYGAFGSWFDYWSLVVNSKSCQTHANHRGHQACSKYNLSYRLSLHFRALSANQVPGTLSVHLTRWDVSKTMTSLFSAKYPTIQLNSKTQVIG
jgi:hypothetical protein